MFTRLQNIIPSAAIKLGVRREIEAAIVCEKYRACAAEIIHPKALNHTAPKFYKNHTLTIAVENPAWAQVVLSHKQKLVAHINGDKKFLRDLKTSVAGVWPIEAKNSVDLSPSGS